MSLQAKQRSSFHHVFQQFSLSSVSLGRVLDSVCAFSSPSPSSFIYAKSMHDSSLFHCKLLYNLVCVPPPANHTVANVFLLSVHISPEQLFLSMVPGAAVPPEAEEERCVVRNGDFHPSPYFYAFGEMRTESLDHNWTVTQFPCGSTLMVEVSCRQQSCSGDRSRLLHLLPLLLVLSPGHHFSLTLACSAPAQHLPVLCAPQSTRCLSEARECSTRQKIELIVHLDQLLIFPCIKRKTAKVASLCQLQKSSYFCDTVT